MTAWIRWRRSRIGALADPAAIDVEAELGSALNEHDPGIDRAEDDHPAIGTVFDEVVDDAALQLERDDFEEKDADGQRHEQQLVCPAGRQHIAEDAARQFVRRGGAELAGPGGDAHRAEI